MADSPPAIKQRCLEYCYTKLGTSNGISLSLSIYIYIKQCTYIYGRLTPSNPIKYRSLQNHYTKSVSDIAQCTYSHSRLTPPTIEHRYLEYHYTKLGTSNGRSLSIYRTMYIYLWQIDPPPIKHRSLQNHYTK